MASRCRCAALFGISHTMSGQAIASLCKNKQWIVPSRVGRLVQTGITHRYLATPASGVAGLPDSIKRVGATYALPNEYPGQVYAFNWCLNGDGVTPLRRSAFRITKPLDLKVAGLEPPRIIPLQVKAADAAQMPEAGSGTLTFEQFDEVSQRTRDLLSLADHLYCPEGHVPGTRTTVRVITNSAVLAPDLLAYLERAPRKEPPESLSITAYLLEGVEESFAGYAVEEIEVPVQQEAKDWVTGNEPAFPREAKSVASVVVVGKKLDIKVVAAGIELSQKALAADEIERESKKQAEAKAKEQAS